MQQYQVLEFFHLIILPWDLAILQNCLLTLKVLCINVIYIYKLNRQDDGAAYRIFCPKNLKCCLDPNNKIKPEFEETFVYLFIIGMYSRFYNKKYELKLITFYY